MAVVAGATRGAGRGIAATLGEVGATVVCTGRSSRSGRLASDYGRSGLRTLRLGVETHLVTAHHLLPLLVARPGGLHVEITDGTAAYNAANYRISAFYDLAKASVNRLAFSLGHEFAREGATALALTPRFLRSEMMLETFGVDESNWRHAVEPPAGSASAPPSFALSESPRYVGRAVAAVACDPARARWNQQSVTSGDLAEVYGFTDVDGSQPQVWRYIEDDAAGSARALTAYR